MGGTAAIELTAVRVTALAAVSALPLLVRIVRTGLGCGVSLTAATIGTTAEVGWVSHPLGAAVVRCP
jgi:hypothetical protein